MITLLRGAALGAVAVFSAVAYSGQASAAVQNFDLSVADSGAGLGAGPFGSVTVTESAGSLDFLVTLAGGYKFHQGNANHLNFVFELVGDPTVNITSITSGFARVAGTNFSAPPFGNNIWGYAVDCTACGPGYPGGDPGPLSFTVTPTSGSLSLASLGFNAATVNSVAYNIYFASDLVNGDGRTGNVGAVIASGVPEPSTWAMMLIGFAGLGLVASRRRRIAVAA